jgi:hypothetical protein
MLINKNRSVNSITIISYFNKKEFKNFSTEVLGNIFSFLPVIDQCRLRKTCKIMNHQALGHSSEQFQKIRNAFFEILYFPPVNPDEIFHNSHYCRDSFLQMVQNIVSSPSFCKILKEKKGDFLETAEEIKKPYGSHQNQKAVFFTNDFSNDIRTEIEKLKLLVHQSTSKHSA